MGSKLFHPHTEYTFPSRARCIPMASSPERRRSRSPRHVPAMDRPVAPVPHSRVAMDGSKLIWMPFDLRHVGEQAQLRGIRCNLLKTIPYGSQPLRRMQVTPMPRASRAEWSGEAPQGLHDQGYARFMWIDCEGGRSRPFGPTGFPRAAVMSSSGATQLHPPPR